MHSPNLGCSWLIERDNFSKIPRILEVQVAQRDVVGYDSTLHRQAKNTVFSPQTPPWTLIKLVLSTGAMVPSGRNPREEIIV